MVAQTPAIHSTAIIEAGADLADGVEVGPYCRVGPRVTLGEGVRLLSHVVVDGRTQIGAGTVVHPFASLGGPPQHLGYRGEDTGLRIGSGNIIREHVTMNLGTPLGRGVTTVGDRCLFMAGSHVAHDCVIADGVILANNATLGGHATVGEGAFLGGLCAVHQFCRIGEFAFVGGCAAVPTDLIPFGSAVGNHAHLAGLNIVGMKRRGVDRVRIHRIRAAFRTLFQGEGAFQDRLDEVETGYGDVDEVARIVRFIREDARRPIMTPLR